MLDYCKLWVSFVGNSLDVISNHYVDKSKECKDRGLIDKLDYAYLSGHRTSTYIFEQLLNYEPFKSLKEIIHRLKAIWCA